MTKNKTVAERLREAVKQRRRCDVDIIGNALGRAVICDSERPCFECEAEWFNALADAIEAEQADLREKSEFERDASRKERDCLCKRIEELERKTSEYKRRLDFRKELADENGVVLKGLRDLANTGKHHSNAEWRRIVMRLTENAEDYANRVIAEARERTKTEHDGVDVDALLKVADEMANEACIPPYKRPSHLHMDYVANWWRRITDAIKNAKPQLPEGIEWPRFEDGQPVKIGDEFLNNKGNTATVTRIALSEKHFTINKGQGRICKTYGNRIKRPEPEVLDADGVPIKVGDTVYWTKGGNAKTVKRIVDGFIEVEESIARLFPEQLTHRKPDTFKSVVEEMLTDFDSHDTIELDGYFDRLRKLMGGEQHG